MIKKIILRSEMRSSCRGRCSLDDNCVSYNVGPAIKNQVSFQLSDSDHVQHPEDLVPREWFMYQSSEMRKFIVVYISIKNEFMHRCEQLLLHKQLKKKEAFLHCWYIISRLLCG